MKIPCFTMACLVVVAGCSNNGPAPVQRTAADDPTPICLSSMENNASVVMLKPRVGSIAIAEAAPLALRSSTAVPTADEKKAIQSWVVLRKDCVNAGAEFRLKNAPPAYADLVEEEHSRFTVLLSRLYAGQVGYGEFLNERIALDNEMKSRRNNARAEHQRANAPIREEEAARRRGELNNALAVLQLTPPPSGKN